MQSPLTTRPAENPDGGLAGPAGKGHGRASDLRAEVPPHVPSLPGGDMVGALCAEVARRVQAGQLALPLLPQVASQVVMLAGNPGADAAQLSHLIHRDPALAGQVLRIANSPTYMPRMPIVSLQQAVARMGLNAVTEIAFVASVQSGTFKVPGYEADLKQLWRHAIASAMFAKEIARIRRSNVEAAFLCGLLHAVGKPALLQVVADVEKTLAREAPVDAVVSAGVIRGTLPALLDEWHTPVGMRIARAWSLPAAVISAIATYACYQQTPGHTQEAVVTCLADRLATDLIYPGTFSDESLLDHSVFGHLNLYPDDVTALRDKRAAVTAAVDAMTA